ncbi:hypothetical protein IWW36_001396 [Coemansia brasiliensis]|uniref:Uncharacterized protein n=1 Tax=Coemansia brasiliensis TaxID=2650707 RepID=A0A9W8IGS0_9FUNG|nr:hypothetical protein IWW36_001396 [Coemansia brasiliensis]
MHWLAAVCTTLLASAATTLAFDVSLLWDVPDDAREITQASAQIQLNSSTSPIGTEWIGVGWNAGAISLQKTGEEQLVVLMQVRAPNDNTTVRAGRVTDYATAHYIDRKDTASRGMYLQSKIDKDDANNSEFSLKVIAHYNMVANNTIYQGLWSDGQVWTYMGSLVLQHPKTSSIKEEVARALEDAARVDNASNKLDSMANARSAVSVGDSGEESSRDRMAATKEPEAPSAPSKDPLGGTKPPETLATCDINRDTTTGHIRPVCKFVRQLPMVESFQQPFSGIRRTSDGNQKFERAGIFKELSLKSRLAAVYDISAARCVSHNRQNTDIASCQRDPNSPEFIISIDGLTPVEAKERANLMEGGNAIETDANLLEESSKIHHEASKLPEVDVA